MDFRGESPMMWTQPMYWAFGHAFQPATNASLLRRAEMRPRTRSSTTSDAYGPQAEQAARIAESNFREAAARRAVYDSIDSIDARAAEIEERERAVAAREQLIRALENRLEDSRRRLEERLEQVKDRRPTAAVDFRAATVDEGYFHAGSYVDEDAWWSRQLGKSPCLAA
jgi:flagellar motility protein MotE (MotC chaperone)